MILKSVEWQRGDKHYLTLRRTIRFGDYNNADSCTNRAIVQKSGNRPKDTASKAMGTLSGVKRYCSQRCRVTAHMQRHRLHEPCSQASYKALPPTALGLKNQITNLQWCLIRVSLRKLTSVRMTSSSRSSSSCCWGAGVTSMGTPSSSEESDMVMGPSLRLIQSKRRQRTRLPGGGHNHVQSFNSILA